MNLLLWVLQVALALLYLAGGAHKTFMFDELANQMGALSRGGWGAVGVLEMLCAVLLVVPAAAKWMPVLTPLAAAALALETLVLAGLYARSLRAVRAQAAGLTPAVARSVRDGLELRAAAPAVGGLLPGDRIPPAVDQSLEVAERLARGGHVVRDERPAGKPRWVNASATCGRPSCASAVKPLQDAMANKTSKKSAKVAKKAAAKRVAAKPTLLAGGNPRIAKADGDTPVQAYIAAIPGWKRDVGRRLDALIVRTVPDVRKAVKWNSPFYGIEGQGWFLNFHCFTKYVKVAFFGGTSLRPLPPGESKHKEVRYLDIHKEDQLDEAQMATWIRQAAARPGWVP